MHPPALLKRIKRHVIGRSRRFFIAAPPGFETLCRDALLGLRLPITDVREEPGGVAFQGKMTDAWAAHLHLRVANRILMRLSSLTATHFGEMEKAAKQFPWELYLPAASPVGFHVSVKQCRLHHTDAIAERLAAGIESRFTALGMATVPEIAGGAGQTLFIRGRRDRFKISLDMSGPLLHKRGIKRQPGQAPIRETLAAAALMLSGYTGDMPLMDPMCGTGTFSVEAALLATRTPPGLFRDFAFMDWPAFQPERWAHIKAQAAQAIRPAPAPIWASDRDFEACQMLKRICGQAGLSPPVHVSCRDFFGAAPKGRSGLRGLVALNPPYGDRLDTDGAAPSFYRRIFAHLKDRFKGWRAVIILPEAALAAHSPAGLRAVPFHHGGRERILLTGSL